MKYYFFSFKNAVDTFAEADTVRACYSTWNITSFLLLVIQCTRMLSGMHWETFFFSLGSCLYSHAQLRLIFFTVRALHAILPYTRKKWRPMASLYRQQL